MVWFGTERIWYRTWPNPGLLTYWRWQRRFKCFAADFKHIKMKNVSRHRTIKWIFFRQKETFSAAHIGQPWNTNQTVSDGVAHSKNPRKCAYLVTFDLDLDLEHALDACWPGVHRVQVCWRSGHLSARRSDLRKSLHQTDRQTDVRRDDGRRAIALAHSWNELKTTNRPTKQLVAKISSKYTSQVAKYRTTNNLSTCQQKLRQNYRVGQKK